MPFEKTINTSSGTIGLWKLSDPSDELIKQCKLSESDQEKYNRFSAERRKREFLASRILLQNQLAEISEIMYDRSGKPSLKNSSKNISISHSADFACIFLSDKNIGIDVEQTNRKIDRIAGRFLHSQEQKFIAGLANQQEAKILFWAAKEAIFKCTNNKGIEFNEQIFIEPFQIYQEGSFNGKLLLKEKQVNFKLHYFFFKNNVLVYCVED